MVAVLFSSQAMAAQYKIYVTASTHVSPAQNELSSMVQRSILLDTSAKTLELQMTPNCDSGSLCPQYIRSVTLKVTKVTLTHGQVTSISASGNLDLNGRPTQAIVQITLNDNNAMDISVTNSSDCKSTHSTFLGSPAQSSSLVRN